MEVSEIFSEYIRDPGKFWPNTDKDGYEQRQVKKVQNRIAKLARKSGKTADQVIGDVMGWAERRRSGHPPTVYVLGRGGAGSNWLAQMLGELRGYLNSGEVWFPDPLVDALGCLPPADGGFVVDCIHLLHAWGLQADRDLSENDFVEASLINPAAGAQVRRNKEWEPRCFVIHLIRDPRDQVASYVFRKPVSPGAMASEMTDWQYMSATAGWLRQNHHRIRSSPVPADMTCRYEDLRGDAATWLPRIARGVGRPVPPEEIERSVKLHGAETIRAGRAPSRGNLSRSEPKGWRAELNDEQKRLVHAELIEVIEDTGYPADECLGHEVAGASGGCPHALPHPEANVPATIYWRPGAGTEWIRLGDGKNADLPAGGDMKIRIGGDLSEAIRGLAGAINTQTVHGLCVAGNASVTDETVSAVAAFAGLRELDLARTGISDSALDVLGRLPSLAEVSLLGTGLTPGAVERFERSSGCAAYLDQRLGADMQTSPQTADARAQAAMADRDWERATALWEEFLHKFEGHVPIQAHLGLSRALRANGRLIAAQTALLERLKHDPEDHRLRRELANLAKSEKTDLASTKAEWEQVASLWEDVLASASNATPQMVNGLAGALCQLGRFREADRTLQGALAAGIDGRSVQSVFDSEVLRTQFLGRLLRAARVIEEQRTKPSGEWYRVAVGARRLRDASELDAAVIAPSAISVSGRGRFVNSIRRLANALEVAESFDVPRVYIHPAWYLDGDDPIDFRGHQVIQSESPSPEERLVLRGSFVHRNAFREVLSGTEEENAYMRLRELRPFTRFRDREPMAENDLVIHIRAGDVFRDESVHPGYGQPPLAYYLTVLRQRRWRSVHLVYENDSNPVIAPLLDHLRGAGIEHTSVVTDLTSMIEYLLRAKTMVAGQGSFIQTIAGLSSNLRRLYTFEGGRMGCCPGVAQTDVIDDRGDYRRAVMSGNWENRPDQVELMLHYPESSLRVGPAPDGAR